MNLSFASRRLATISLMVLAPVVEAQEPLSTTALRRFAEALDGNRTGTPVLIVACRDSAYRVGGVVNTRAEADSLRRRLGVCYGIFGPFISPRDLLAHKAVRGCVHDGHTSNEDPSPICPVSPFALSDVASMTLVTRLKNGTVHEMSMGPEVDAIFLSLPAIDKFMIPYYARVLGVDSAVAMRTQIVLGLSR
jgi:hypothetical protein